MKTKQGLLPALVLSALTAFAAPAVEAAQSSGVYVSGDSISDAGYYRAYLLGNGVPAITTSLVITGAMRPRSGLSLSYLDVSRRSGVKQDAWGACCRIDSEAGS